MIDLTPILQALLGLLATLVTVKVIPWIKSRTTAQQQATLSIVVDVLVYASEQMFGVGNGEQKLKYVATGLKERGFMVDIDLIEAQVKKMNEKAITAK